MKLNVLRNKKGSALLWCILLTIILTILLGSVLTAAYAYFTYTTNSIKRTQAYYTARSALSAVIEEFSSSDESHQSSGGSGSTIYTYNSSIDLMPTEGETITINKFDGLDSSLGTAKGEIKLNENNEQQVDITVTGTYADQEYTMKATVGRQPLSFGGIAVKELTLGVGSKFVLGENTDLYYYTYRNETLKGNQQANTFDTTSTATNGSTIVINGNLITQGDAKIGNGVTVAGHRFNADTTFSAAGHPRKVWNKEQYILSNRTLEVKEKSGKYSTSVANVLGNLTNYNLITCNNSRWSMNDGYYIDGKYISLERTAHFGSPLSILSEVEVGALKIVDGALKTLSGGGDNYKGPFSKMYADNSVSDLAVTGSSSDGLAIKYIQIISASTTMQTVKNDVVSTLKKNTGLLGGFIVDQIDSNVLQPINNAFNEYGMTVMDISYVQYDSNNLQTFGDKVYPVTYMFVEGNANQGVYVRVKYGQKPDSESALAKLGDRISTRIDQIANNWFDIVKESSFVVVYLGENSTFELGTQTPYIGDISTDPVFTAANQTYFYSIYGSEGSTVILNGNNNTGVPLTFIGEIQCDNLQVNGDVNVVYSSTNGSQVAKQKVGDFWTVLKYSD